MIRKAVQCDNCLSTAETSDGPVTAKFSDEARALATREGWVRRGGKDICRECQEDSRD